MKLIDCTLRDGGYWNNWNWPDSLLQDIVKISEKDDIIIETGYQSPQEMYRKTRNSANLFYCDNTQQIFMIDAKEYIGLNHSPINQYWCNKDAIRIAIKEDELDYTLPYIERDKEYGDYGQNIFFNLMYIHFVSEERLVEVLNRVKGVVPDIRAFYIADSFGMLQIDDLKRLYGIISEYFPVGAHLHNNDGKAYEKVLACQEIGYDYCDVSILGMGRGAGNPNTCDFVNVDKNIVERIQKMKDVYNWGPNYAYAKSAELGIHPFYAKWALGRYTIAFCGCKECAEELTTRFLNSIPESKRRSFDQECCDNYTG